MSHPSPSEGFTVDGSELNPKPEAPTDSALAELEATAACRTAGASRAAPPDGAGATAPNLEELIDRSGNGTTATPSIEVLQGILDTFPHYVMLLDAEHQILIANAAVRAALDVDPSKIAGGYCPKLVHGEDGPYEGCPLEESLQTGQAIEREYTDPKTLRTLRSGIFPTPYATAAGRTVYLHTVQDITEQRSAERRVRRNNDAQRLVNEVLRISLESRSLQEILETVVERIVALPWLADHPRGVIFLTSESGEELVLAAQRGLPPETARSCARVPFGDCLCGKAAASGEVQFSCGDVERPRHGGSPLPSHGHYCVPMKHGDTVVGVLNTYIDEGHEYDDSELEFLSAIADALAGIIKRKRAEDLQAEHQRVALSRERMARVGEFSAGVAHTVRNPLHGVLSCVEILEGQAERDEAPAIEILALMKDGLERIEKVTRRLLALTRESAQTRHPTQVGSLLSDVLDLMTIQAEKQGIELRLDADFAGEMVLNADRVIEGLTSVVSNALDACGEGDRVTVRSRLASSLPTALVLEVEDTGPGIPAEDLPRVLDPFFTTKPIGEGSGLGLAIARRVVDEHHGDIKIESTEGEGTVVRLVLPADIVPAGPSGT